MNRKRRRSQVSRSNQTTVAKPERTVQSVGEQILALVEQGIREGQRWCKDLRDQVMAIVRERRGFDLSFHRNVIDHLGSSWGLNEYYNKFSDLADDFDALLKSPKRRIPKRQQFA